MKPVTVYDIAREANVSVATVSRVLNNTAPVKASTRERIMGLIQKHQFQPNALARSLIKKETGMIGIILPDITNPFFPEVLAGLEQEARNNGYTFFLCDTGSSNQDIKAQYQRESQYLNILMEKQVDGIIMIGGRIDLARCSKEMAKEVAEVNKRLPVVLINGNLPGAKFHRVIIDEVAGGVLATEHLIGLGHTDIAFIGGYKQMSNTVQRLEGYTKAMQQAGLQIREDWIITGGFTVEAGKVFMNQLLGGETENRPTAIVCANDLSAIGAIKAAVKHGLRVPEDMSIIGFDDIPLAANVIPELTTISLKCLELGRTAAHILHQLIGKNGIDTLTVLQPELVVRESTAPLRVGISISAAGNVSSQG
ncbi:LacI family DNA-binding transcriptional regulator [Paenibacillus lignilyticus]|uniref:LacI family DNA-binding transcriptional regulator n=1 Tax=Paenibacillus lignilyticus TaxID=1172615 RepID=A0ABS5CL75_9BACL|nr:LacI family DNA-binding transcriptional regulator [Paenibacillus lignilyticus]MBP3966618.1 LacI family DNA-binding transcriptional regulator [Paenibacillus lignilyticus]